MTEHTPTPWRASCGNLIRVMQPGTGVCIAGVHKIGVRTGEPGDAVAINNAAFIVRACNSHDVLVKALTDIAQGNVPPNFISEAETKESFREKFGPWLQKTAQGALDALAKGGE